MGYQLWKSDGTDAGTMMVSSFVGTSLSDLANVNGILVFTASENAVDYRLWKSDGTSAGTSTLTDLDVKRSDGAVLPASPVQATVNGKLFFVASPTGDVMNYKLWKTDGTETGTVLVKDFAASGLPTGVSPSNLTDVKGTLFFSICNINPAAMNYQLWKSDGTDGGTVMVCPDIGGPLANFTGVGGTLFFTARQDAVNWKLWKSDGTAPGTLMVRDVDVKVSETMPTSQAPCMADVNGVLYFIVNDGSAANQLWQSNGTEAGTTMVKDFDPDGAAGGFSLWNLTNVNGLLYFTLYANNRYQLWQSDGTAAGTLVVSPDVGTQTANLSAAGSALFFTASSDSAAVKLWRSIGFDTVMINIGVKASDTVSMVSAPCLVPAADALFFVGTYNLDGTGHDVWKIPADEYSLASWLTGDINGDGKVGLEDAVNTLQIVSGLKTAGSDPGNGSAAEQTLYSASGSYVRDADNLQLNVTQTDFPALADLTVGIQELSVSFVTDKTMWLFESIYEPYVFARKSGEGSSLVGTWVTSLYPESSREITFYDDGTFLLSMQPFQGEESVVSTSWREAVIAVAASSQSEVSGYRSLRLYASGMLEEGAAAAMLVNSAMQDTLIFPGHPNFPNLPPGALQPYHSWKAYGGSSDNISYVASAMVESVTERVVTPAGQFENCIQITYDIAYDSDPGSGFWVIEGITRYFKENVGVVKVVIQRPGFSETTELTAFDLVGEGIVPLEAGNSWTYQGSFGWERLVVTSISDGFDTD